MFLKSLALVASVGLAFMAAAAPHQHRPQPQQPTWRAVQPESGEVHLTNIRQLTFGGQNAEAYYSTDGKKIVFQSTRGDHPCDQEYVMNVDGSDVHRVSNGLGRTTCGYFFDHDRKVLFSSTSAAGRDCPKPPDYSHGYVWALEDFDIFTANVDGTGLRRLTRTPGYNAEAVVSPDGKSIVFTSTRHGDLDIYTMRLDGTHVRQLTHELGYDGGPWFSHDGKRIVYRAYHPGTAADSAKYRQLYAQHLVQPLQMELWVMNVDGTDRHQITHLGGGELRAVFYPGRPEDHLRVKRQGPARPELRPLPRQPRRDRARAGDHAPGVRQLPDVLPRREETRLGVEP
jgi:Tol biopolymer transport system component